MQTIEIIVIVASVLIVLGVSIGGFIRKRKNKKSGCIGNCAGCPYCNSCGSLIASENKSKSLNEF